MHPQINPEIKSLLRWYNDPVKRSRHQCKCDDPTGVDVACIYATLFPANSIPPFQFLASGGSGPVTAWTVRKLDGTFELDLSAFIVNLAVYDLLEPARAIVELNAGLVSSSLSSLQSGKYEMEMVVGGDTYYSETFKASCLPAKDLHLLSWRDCGDLGTVHYKGGPLLFRNQFWIDPADVDIGAPIAKLVINNDSGSKGQDVRTVSSKEVEWTLAHKGAPWYVIDALTDGMIASDVRLKLSGVATTSVVGISDGDVLTPIAVEYEWQEEVCSPPFSVVFKVPSERVYKSSCCDAFIPACPEVACVTALSVVPASVDDLIETETYLFNDGTYATYIGSSGPAPEDGWGPHSICWNRYAIIDDGAVYYDGAAWRRVAVITSTSQVSCTSDPVQITVVAVVMPGFNGQLQHNIEGDTTQFQDAGTEHSAEEWAQGVLVEIPAYAAYVRIRVFRDDCEVGLGLSDAVLNPCFCDEAGPFFGTIATNYDDCPAFWSVDFDMIDSTATFTVVGLKFRINEGEWVEWLNGPGPYGPFEFNEGEEVEFEVVGASCNYLVDISACP